MLLFFLVAVLVGGLVIVLWERYRIPLRDWILAEPEELAERLGMIIALLAIVSVAPLIGFAGYLWSLGARTLRAREFPPPGLRVIRDTRIITGDGAASRGRQLKLLAGGFLVAALVLGFLLWRLAALFSDHAV
jgi:hypothetical protein